MLKMKEAKMEYGFIDNEYYSTFGDKRKSNQEQDDGMERILMLIMKTNYNIFIEFLSLP